jgi:hypothetical protein
MLNLQIRQTRCRTVKSPEETERPKDKSGQKNRKVVRFCEVVSQKRNAMSLQIVAGGGYIAM